MARRGNNPESIIFILFISLSVFSFMAAASAEDFFDDAQYEIFPISFFTDVNYDEMVSDDPLFFQSFEFITPEAKITGIDVNSLSILEMNLESRNMCDEALLYTVMSGTPVPLLWPVTGGVISSGFGKRVDPIRKDRGIHKGLDIFVPMNTPVLVTADGIVTFAGKKNGYGNVIYIDHGNGLATRYAHLNKILVDDGDIVCAGDEIGKVGKTGRATGPHLHYEVLWLDEQINPKPFLVAGQ